MGENGGESSSLVLTSLNRGRNDQLVPSNESPYMMNSPKVKYSEDVDYNVTSSQSLQIEAIRQKLEELDKRREQIGKDFDKKDKAEEKAEKKKNRRMFGRKI